MLRRNKDQALILQACADVREELKKAVARGEPTYIQLEIAERLCTLYSQLCLEYLARRVA